jgi:exonuclease SbcD
MRIVHTADWHAGRVWKNQHRLPELEAVLEHLGDFIERERIDLVLVAGDLFEHQMPSPEAERVVSRFFLRLGRAGVPSVVIAGNHDHPLRLENWGLFAELVGVRARSLPRPPEQGGLIEVATRAGEIARVAAVPWASPGRLVEALTLARDETQARQQYADLMRQIFERLASGFRPDTVNLVVAHAHLDGARVGGSERVVTLGEEWASLPQALPPTAQYVALGHIHRPQRMASAVAHSEYAGSALQLDFGEVGDEKSFVVVEVAPGRPPRVERVPYEGGKMLGDWAGTLPELEQAAPALARFGYLRVKVTLAEDLPDLNRQVRQIVPNAVVVDKVLPVPALDGERTGASAAGVAAAGAPSARAAGGVAPIEPFRAFYLRQHQQPPAEATLALFRDLYAAAAAEE